MAPPTNGGFVQGLLQSLGPWMNGANPSGLDNSFQQYGGTQGLLDAMLQANTPGNLGRGMEGVQDEALQRAGQRQQLASGALNMQLTASKIPAIQAYYRMLGGMMGVGGSQAAGAPGSPPGANGTGPQAGPATAGPAPAGGGPPGVGPAGAAPPSMGAPGPTAQGAPSGSPAQGGFWSNPLGVMRFGTLGAALGLPGGQQFANYGKTAIQYDPQTATQMALAKDPLTLDKQMMQEAQQSGNAQDYLSAYTKFLTDSNRLHISSMSGNVTGFGLPPAIMASMANYNPQTGKFTANGKQGLIPGAAETEQALAGAEARGRAQGDVEKVTDGNGNEYYVPRSTLLGGGGQGASGGSPGIQGTTPFQAEIGPASEELLKDKGTQAAKVNEEFQGKAEAGQQMLAQIAELRSAASDFSPGQFADSRIKMLQWMQSSGLISSDQAKELGSAQAGQKIAIQLQAAATKQLGSREAAQIFQVMGKSLPNLTLSPDGLSKVSGYMSGIARYDIARAQMAQSRLAKNDVNGLNGVRDEFIKNTSPTYFIISSMPPAQRAEMIQSMGPRAKGFVEAWNNAANAGWAPRPGAYDGS